MKLLNRQEVDQLVADLWTKVGEIPEDEPLRDEEVEKALKEQTRLYQTLARQQSAFKNLLTTCVNINSVDPLGILERVANNEKSLRLVMAGG